MNCGRSGVRVPISVGDEVARTIRCEWCHRLLRIRPTRRAIPPHWPGGNPTAVLPRHNDDSDVATETRAWCGAEHDTVDPA